MNRRGSDRVRDSGEGSEMWAARRGRGMRADKQGDSDEREKEGGWKGGQEGEEEKTVEEQTSDNTHLVVSSGFKHDNILRMLLFIEENQAIVMEFAENGSLESYLHHLPQPLGIDRDNYNLSSSALSSRFCLSSSFLSLSLISISPLVTCSALSPPPSPLSDCLHNLILCVVVCRMGWGAENCTSNSSDTCSFTQQRSLSQYVFLPL